jgi:hypothetical protein
MPTPLFQKGHPGYKKKGTPNKKTKQWGDLGEFLANEGSERALQIMREAPKDKFMKYYLEMLEYFKPKLSRVDNLQLPENTPGLNAIQIFDSNAEQITDAIVLNDKTE